MRGMVVVLSCCTALLASQSPTRTDLIHPTTILVSIDGWRWDYDRRYPAPALRQLAARGVRAQNLISTFPSKTFPSHYTVATGRYPGHHGLISNNILDPATGRRFSLSNRTEVQDPMWWGGLPLWVSLERKGQATAPIFWPGSEAPIGGARPRHWRTYDAGVSASQRVDNLLALLDRPAAERPTFLTLYFEDVDNAGHGSGPESAATRDAVQRIDREIGRLVAGLERRQWLDRINIVLTSDHGMSATSDDRVIVLDDYISLADVDVVDLNPNLALVPRPGAETRVYEALRRAHPRLTVYRRAESPPRWHYRDHPRIPPIVGVADDGWQIVRRSTVLDRLARRLVGGRGEHGYDPEAMSMRGVFVAAGPAFKRGVTVPPFENVHIYEALAAAHGLQPEPNDGDAAVARRLLR